MIRQHVTKTPWVDLGRTVVVSLPCEPWNTPTPRKSHHAPQPEQFQAKWSDEEITQLIALDAAGLSHAEIGEKIGRSKSSVEGKLRRMKGTHRAKSQSR